VSRLPPLSRVLLTGATGFIGSHALRLLEERGHEVHSDRVNLLDSGSAERLVRAARPTHLLHLAWYAVPGKFWMAP
jgi:nucleoside-diphosphate-sugar epimerase